MKLNLVEILALAAGFALYQVCGPEIQHLRGLIDTLVLVELISRVVRKTDRGQ